MIVDNLSEEGIVGFQINDYLEYRPGWNASKQKYFSAKMYGLNRTVHIVCIPGWKVIVK